MEGLVFLAIIALVVRSLYSNSKEAKRKAEERRQARGEDPVQQPKQRPRPRMPGSLPEWIEMLEGKIPMEREEKPAPPPAPQVYVPQGESTEGCLTYPQDCESPHRALQMEKRWEEPNPTEQQGSPLAFLEGMPEVVKGVVYAEILTRPQQRRRLRP